ncbi:MAG: ECF transporter S component [Armatimonadota bacterium]|nr:ECF transporter S component [Armatimonadota bacterium]MCX7777507.1 ECF transporter S component [Armatimonadota bacterium]MDW8025983.1 ECF transporter S component [Armatimonadota bacterium]
MRFNQREVVVGGLFCAIGVILPVLFHAVGLGRSFLPMHLPILALGLLTSPLVAACGGFITPLASLFLTGMPPLPTALLMAVELPVLGASASFFRHRLRLPLLLCVISAIAARCLADIVLAYTFAPLLQLPPGAFGIASILVGLPGIVLQVVAVPPIVLLIERSRGIEQDERG